MERLKESGIIVPSTSPWSFPLVPLQKPDGTIRVCVDYRKLNQVTKADPHYMPMLAEIVDRIGACGVISKLDITHIKGLLSGSNERGRPAQDSLLLSIWQVSIHTCSIWAQ